MFFNLFRLRFFGLVMIAIILYCWLAISPRLYTLYGSQQVRFKPNTKRYIRCKLWSRECVYMQKRTLNNDYFVFRWNSISIFFISWNSSERFSWENSSKSGYCQVIYRDHFLTDFKGKLGDLSIIQYLHISEKRFLNTSWNVQDVNIHRQRNFIDSTFTPRSLPPSFRYAMQLINKFVSS